MLDVDYWKFVNTFAPWLSGIGSLFAVIISLCSLYITLRDMRVNLSVRTIIDSSIIKNASGDYICVSVINRGRRVAVISNIYLHYIQWCSFKFYNVFPPTYNWNGDSLSFPIRIEEGDGATYKLSVNEIFTKLIGTKMRLVSQRDISILRVTVETSTGKLFTARFNREIRQAMRIKLRESYSNIIPT